MLLLYVLLSLGLCQLEGSAGGRGNVTRPAFSYEVHIVYGAKGQNGRFLIEKRDSLAQSLSHFRLILNTPHEFVVEFYSARLDWKPLVIDYRTLLRGQVPTSSPLLE